MKWDFAFLAPFAVKKERLNCKERKGCAKGARNLHYRSSLYSAGVNCSQSPMFTEPGAAAPAFSLSRRSCRSGLCERGSVRVVQGTQSLISYRLQYNNRSLVYVPTNMLRALFGMLLG